jgi:hypothetical protein
MLRNLRLTVGFTVLATFFSGISAADSNNKCSNGTLKGSYGLVGNGTVIGVGPAALVGILTYDGRGNVTGISIQKVNGNNVTLTLSGTYSVDATCIANDVVAVSNGQTATHTAVIVDNGKELYILNTTPPTAISGNVLAAIAKEQFRED